MYFQSKHFKAPKVAGFSIYLNEDEINQIYELDLSKTPHFERVRDLFIVGCWTGLRFSDFTAIKPENIKDEYLEIKTFKTGEKLLFQSIQWFGRLWLNTQGSIQTVCLRPYQTKNECLPKRDCKTGGLPKRIGGGGAHQRRL